MQSSVGFFGSLGCLIETHGNLHSHDCHAAGTEAALPDRKRRRRADVDYKALDKKLRAEEGVMLPKPE